jgi:hypothetical protein
MLRPEFMSASDTTEDKFTLAVSTMTDVPSFESGSWPEKWRTLEDVNAVSKVLDSDMKESLRSAGVKGPQGTCRSCHSRTQFPQFKSVREAELCRNTDRSSRERTFRSRNRQFKSAKASIRITRITRFRQIPLIFASLDC